MNIIYEDKINNTTFVIEKENPLVAFEKLVKGNCDEFNIKDKKSFRSELENFVSSINIKEDTLDSLTKKYISILTRYSGDL